MTIDSYSLCPGGTDKKIKFCCSDLVNDLPKIHRMLEGQQYQAVRQHLDRLMERYPDRACLFALKTLVLRATDQPEEAVQVAATFLERHPENVVALAEGAIAAAQTKDAPEAIDLLQRSLSARGPSIPGRVYMAIGVVARRCLMDGEYLAARALFLMQTAFNSEDELAVRFLTDLARSPEAALLLKDDRSLDECPEGARWEAQFQEAMSQVDRGCWRDASQTFAGLADKVPDCPAIWMNLGLTRAWLADRAGAIEALQKYAALDVTPEDAAEALALSRLLSDDPLGDDFQVFDLRYRVGDVEHIEAVLSSSPRIAAVQADLASLAEDGEPPPKAAYWILDRDTLKSADDLSLRALPQVVCQAVLFGRQTDRDACLEVDGVAARSLDQVKSLLAELGRDQLDCDTEPEVVDHESATAALVSRNWHLPPDVQPKQVRQLAERHLEEVLLEAWPELPLGMLDGKTPGEAAAQPEYQVKLMAAVLVVQSLLDRSSLRFDFHRLRSHLRLPELAPIDPDQTPVDKIPLVRLARVAVEKLDQQTLMSCFQRALFFNASEALEKLAREIVGRPSLEGTRENLAALGVLPKLVADDEEALGYIDQGRQAAQAQGQSCASWDLTELSLRFQRLETSRASQLLEHLQRAHSREPGVMDAVTRMLIEIGAIAPDGTARAPEAPPAAEEPGIVIPGQEATEPGKLWTPDGEQSGGEKPKIWTPGMG